MTSVFVWEWLLILLKKSMFLTKFFYIGIWPRFTLKVFYLPNEMRSNCDTWYLERPIYVVSFDNLFCSAPNATARWHGVGKSEHFPPKWRFFWKSDHFYQSSFLQLKPTSPPAFFMHNTNVLLLATKHRNGNPAAPLTCLKWTWELWIFWKNHDFRMSENKQLCISYVISLLRGALGEKNLAKEATYIGLSKYQVLQLDLISLER